jgi:predicted ATP-binding protein involved in virulence
MRIRQLTVENFRVFTGAVTFPFSDRFTVVAGVNGRGKTAILDAIALLSSRFLPQVSPAIGLQRKVIVSDISSDAVILHAILHQ